MKKMALITTGCLLAGVAFSSSGSDSKASVFVVNGNFESWQDGSPSGWQSDGKSTLSREEYFTYCSPNAIKVVINADAGKAAGGRLFQDLSLKPNTTYNLDFAMAKHGTGSVQVRVQPIVNGRLLSGPKTALNWTNVWSWRFPWNRQRLEFTTGAETLYRLTFLNLGQPGDPFWLGEVALSPKEIDEESNAQFVLYQESVMRPFLEEGRSGTERELRSLFSQGTPGDYSPEFVGLTALRPLRQVDVKLGKPLTNARGETLPPESLIIRSVAEQALLPLSKPRFVGRGKNAGWWVTMKVPADAAPGVYQGSLEVVSGASVLAVIPYSLRVEAFELPKPEIPMFVYHADVYFPADSLSREARLMYYRDMKEHGMNTVTLYANPDVNGREIDFQKDYRYASMTDERLAATLKRNQWSAEELEARKSYGVAPLIELIKESGLIEGKGVIPWLPLKAGGYTFGDMPSTALTRSVEEWQRHESWPKPLLYVMDEPYGQPDRIAVAKKALERIRRLNLPLPTMTANLPVPELGQDYDIWVQGARRVNSEMAVDAARLGKELWAYNCNMPTDNAPFTRAYFGFWAFRSKVKGVGLWAYYDAKTWYMDGEGKVHGRNGPAQLSRICPSPTGPVPTISWETTREGIIDYRYAMLFERTRKQLAERREQWEEAIRSVHPKAPLVEWKESYGKAALRKSLTEKWGATERESWWPQLEQWDELHEAIVLADAVEDKVLLSVPYDLFAPMGAIPWSSENGRFLPVMGFGDPSIAAEEKRAILSAYIRSFNALLERAKLL